MDALAQLTSGADAQAKLGNLVDAVPGLDRAAGRKMPRSPPRRKETGELLLNNAKVAARRIEEGIELLRRPAMPGSLPHRQPRHGHRGPTAHGRDAKQAARIDPARMAAVPARVPADEPEGHRRPASMRPRGRGPALLPHRRRQDRGVSRPGGLHARAPAAAEPRHRLGRAERADALHAPPADARPARPCLDADLCAWSWSGRRTSRSSANGRSRSGCGSAGPRRRTAWAARETTIRSRPAQDHRLQERDDAPRRRSRSRNAPGAAPSSPRTRSSWCRMPTIRPISGSPASTATATSAAGGSLPILAVDEPIYRRLPCFLIATVDKFAAMPWTGEVGAFFGRVQRYDQHGFYGPCQPNVGHPLPGERLLPPDLIIQDELHLISGPLGTMVGLYETALDELCTRTRSGKRIRPKIVASTATVRRAENADPALVQSPHGRHLPAARSRPARFLLRPSPISPARAMPGSISESPPRDAAPRSSCCASI